MKSTLLFLAIAIVTSASIASSKPNIVLFFIDDMGYGDIGPFGSTQNRTPHLDRLAKGGLKLTNFYVSSTNCTPSRSALLTGSYAERIGMGGEVVFPADPRGLNPSEITIAEMLKERGYATGCFGKWHLGDMPQFMPLKQGFDEYEGIPYSNDMWVHNTKKKLPPLPYMKQDKAVAQLSDAESQAVLCEATTRATIDFIRRHRDEPFFAYVPHSAVHLPRLAPKEWADRADGNVTRAQIEELDASVGRVVETLEELGLAKNTLVFFTSDNGGAKGTSMGPLRGGKGGVKYEGHMRVPTLAWWPGKIAAGTVSREIATTTDLLPTLASLTGATVPPDRVIDGKDVSSLLFKAKAKSPHSVLYYGYDGVRVGHWKLVVQRRKNKKVAFKEPRMFLYNLEADLGEKNDLSGQYPKKVTEMNALLEAHIRQIESDLRPAGKASNPVAILDHDTTLPTLPEYMGMSDTEAFGYVDKKLPEQMKGSGEK